MKQFVKALDRNGECFLHIASTLPALFFEMEKAGGFNGPQIRTLVSDKIFITQMKNKERTAWVSFAAVMENFLGNKKAANYESLIA